MIGAGRDRFGLRRAYVSADAEGPTIRGLLGADRTLDPIAIDAFLRGEWPTDRTMFAAVRQHLPAGPGDRHGEFGPQLVGAIARAVQTAPRPLAVALSGGLDSAVVLAHARRLDPTIDALVLDPGIADYRETDAACRTAEQLDCTVVEISVDDGAFTSDIRAAIGAFEMPLYNLHPLSKWHLAWGAKRAGYATVLTGDGADQLFRHDTSADYLPLVGAAFAAHGVTLCTPFLDIDGVARDPIKRLLREHAAGLPIRDELVVGPKVSRLAPPLPFDAPFARLAALLGRPVPAFTDDADRVRWGTLALLVDSFEAWP